METSSHPCKFMKTKGHIKTDIFSNKTNVVFTFTTFLIIVNYSDIPVVLEKKALQWRNIYWYEI